MEGRGGSGSRRRELALARPCAALSGTAMCDLDEEARERAAFLGVPMADTDSDSDSDSDSDRDSAIEGDGDASRRPRARQSSGAREAAERRAAYAQARAERAYVAGQAASLAAAQQASAADEAMHAAMSRATVGDYQRAAGCGEGMDERHKASQEAEVIPPLCVRTLLERACARAGVANTSTRACTCATLQARAERERRNAAEFAGAREVRLREEAAARVARRAALWDAHEAAWDALPAHGVASAETVVPWPPAPDNILGGMMSARGRRRAQLSDSRKGGNAGWKAAYRVAMQRWHPDKFSTRFAAVFGDDKDAALEAAARCSAIAQAITAEWGTRIK